MLFYVILSLSLNAIRALHIYSRSDVKVVGCYGTKETSNTGLGVEIESVEYFLDKCFAYCDMKGTMYAGLQFSERKCYCSDHLVDSEEFPNDFCLIPIPSEGSAEVIEILKNVKKGTWKMTVYQIQEKSTPTLLVSTENGIRRYRDKSFKSLIEMNIKDQNYGLDYHYRRNEIYFISDAKIYRSRYNIFESKYSSPEVIVKAQDGDNLSFLSLDWVEDQIYFSQSGIIYRANLDGTNKTNITTEGDLAGLTMDPYMRVIFYVNATDGLIRKYDLDKKEKSAVVGQTALYQTVVDVHNKTIFGKSDKTLIQVDYEGHLKNEIDTISENRSSSIIYVTVGLDGEVFYSQSGERRTEFYSFINNSSKLLIGFDDQKEMNNIIKFYHERAQSDTEEVACAKLQCEHGCAFISQSYARCNPSQEPLFLPV